MNRDYIIKQTDENTWVITDEENGKTIHTITKDTLVNYCKREWENNSDHMSSSGMIDNVWYYMNYDYDWDLVNHYCQEYDKFLAWFDYICADCIAKEIVAFYKQRLLDFE